MSSRRKAVLPFNCDAGDAAQQALLGILVPLLVEAAAPEGAPVTPSLRDLSVQLVSALAASPAAPAFKATVAALPQSLKARLQGVLVAGAAPAAAAAAGSAGAAAASKRAPTIQLKTSFAVKS